VRVREMMGIRRNNLFCGFLISYSLAYLEAETLRLQSISPQ
jgi:hypothetical protein